MYVCVYIYIYIYTYICIYIYIYVMLSVSRATLKAPQLWGLCKAAIGYGHLARGSVFWWFV